MDFKQTPWIVLCVMKPFQWHPFASFWVSYKLVKFVPLAILKELPNFTKIYNSPEVSKKDIIGKVSLQGKQWCLFRLRISFLPHISSNFELKVITP